MQTAKPTGADVQFMNAYIQKLSRINYELNQKSIMLEVQLEIAQKRIQELEAPKQTDDGFTAGAIINK